MQFNEDEKFKDLVFGLSEISPFHLPKEIKLLVEGLGVEDTAKIIMEFGGERMYSPKKRPSTSISRLSKLIGLDRVGLIFDALRINGSFIEIPRTLVVLRFIRNRRILADLSAGMTIPAVAKKYGLTSRHITNIK